MRNEDAEADLPEGRNPSPATDDLARVMDWIGLSAAVGMLVVAVILAL